ncbi:MAG: mechanosensitive ion channel [SAR324 cluster bacterium]|nr:mechanosensitive ion channel [SAR324 cluster bacterium]
MNHKKIWLSLFAGIVLVAHGYAQQVSENSITAEPSVTVIEPSVAENTPPESLPPANSDEVSPEKSAPPKAKNRIPGVLKDTKPQIEWSLTFGRVTWSILFLGMAYYAIKYTTRLLEASAEKWPNARLALKRWVPVIRVMGWIFCIYLIIAGVLAPPIETILTMTASAGIALGFASQDILKNVFGGIMILMDRPFFSGDKIQVGNHYGEVTQIGLRTVRIVTADDSVVSIPNGDIVNQPVSNSNSGESNCQVVAEFYLPPDIDFTRVKRMAYRAAVTSRYAYLNKPVYIVFKNEMYERRSMIKMRLKAYVLDIRYEVAFASEMTEIVMFELRRQNLVSTEQLSHLPQIVSNGETA